VAERQPDEPQTQLVLNVRPGAARNRVRGRHGEGYRIEVRSPAVDGRANEELLRFLADLLALEPASLMLVSGARSRRKLVRVRNLGEADVRQRLDAAAR
jgi:uncharacterized protein (TIGR00251 family)